MRLSTKALQAKNSSRIIITLNNGGKYVYVCHYDMIIAKGIIDDGQLVSIEIYSSVASNSDIKTINEAFRDYGVVKKIKGEYKLKKHAESEYQSVFVNIDLHCLNIND